MNTSGSQKKILILLNDSDPLLARVCKNKFSKEAGWDAVITSKYEEAIEAVQKNVPDILLTEIILAPSSKSGFDLMRDLKTLLPAGSKMRIIVFTELGQSADKERALALGASDYFVKSEMTIHEVIERIKIML